MNPKARPMSKCTNTLERIHRSGHVRHDGGTGHDTRLDPPVDTVGNTDRLSEIVSMDDDRESIPGADSILRYTVEVR